MLPRATARKRGRTEATASRSASSLPIRLLPSLGGGGGTVPLLLALICGTPRIAMVRGQSSIVTCPSGAHNEHGTRAACTIGKYRIGCISYSCTWQLKPDTCHTAVCETCEAGYHQGSGHYEGDYCDMCTRRYSVRGAASCVFTHCPAGTFADNSGGPHRCANCAPGRFSAKAHQISSTACAVCPMGYYGEYDKAWDYSQSQSCNACPTGKYNNHTEKYIYAGNWAVNSPPDPCLECPIGWGSANVNEVGQAACTPCQNGYYANEEGQSSCKACPRGKYGSSQHPTGWCATCPAGYESSSGGTSSCAECAAGRYNPQPGSSGVFEKGYWSSGTSTEADDVSESHDEEADCQKCPTGKYSTQPGRTTEAYCIACPAGKSQSSTGASSNLQCKSCDAGKYTSANASAICNPCPA